MWTIQIVAIPLFDLENVGLKSGQIVCLIIRYEVVLCDIEKVPNYGRKWT